MRLLKFPIAIYCITIVATVACNNGSGLKGSGAKTSNQSGSSDGTGDYGDGDGSAGGDGHSGDDSGNSTGGNAGTDLSKTGFDKREKLPDGTVQLVKKGESTKSILPVDIIFALDTSGSMDQEKIDLKAKIPEFLKKLDAVGTSLDYRVWMIANDSNFLSGNNSKIELINVEVSSTDALKRFSEFVTATGPFSAQVKTKLREQSQKHFVVITDDNANGFLAADFINLVKANSLLKDRTSVSGVIGLTKGAGAAGSNCDIANVGEQYQMLAGIKLLANGEKSPLNNGLILDLCTANWTGQLVDGLANKVISETLKLEFPLPGEAKTASNFTVKIGGKDLAKTSYIHDATKNALIFTPSTAPKAGEEMVVRYVPKAS